MGYVDFVMLLEIIAAVVVGLIILVKLYLCHTGTEHVVVQTESRTPFALDEQTDTTLTFSTVLDFVNDGKQCCTIMDAFVRPHLPYEQYAGLETKGHAENIDAPREDDYFEAWIIEAKEQGKIKAQVKLTARQGMNVKEAIAKMPDFNFQLIWLETGRTPCHYRQVRIEVPAAEIAALAGVELVQE